MKESLFDLSDQTIMVTGGTGLLGEPICRSLAKQGATIIITDIDRDRGSELENEIENAIFFYQDITDVESIQRTCDEVLSCYNRIDGLVNTAYPRNQNYGQPFESVKPEDWRENVNLHLGGYYSVIHEVVLRMLEAGTRGSIVNFASIYGIQAPDFSVYDGTSMTSPVEYAAIKGGILNLTRYLASYLGPDGIRVNAVSPGGVYDGQTEEFVNSYESRVPLGRMASPEDVTGAVIYLLSDTAEYVTGHNLVVDGGWSIK